MHPEGTDPSAPTAKLVVCILGMHRSGTSCLAGSLQQAGLALGADAITQAPYNRKGNRENPRIMALHQDLLEANGGSWHSPPERVVWDREHRDRRAEIIASFRHCPVWGFKDPRSLLVVAGWREALPNLRFVGTVRHPLAVARSLNARDRFDLQRGIALWTYYNRLLLRLRSELGFPVVSFDLDPVSYDARLIAVAGGFGLSPPPGGFTFFDRTLRQPAVEPNAALPAEAAEIYRKLSSQPAAAAGAARI